jgi:hypothetical protein
MTLSCPMPLPVRASGPPIRTASPAAFIRRRGCMSTSSGRGPALEQPHPTSVTGSVQHSERIAERRMRPPSSNARAPNPSSLNGHTSPQRRARITADHPPDGPAHGTADLRASTRRSTCRPCPNERPFCLSRRPDQCAPRLGAWLPGGRGDHLSVDSVRHWNLAVTGPTARVTACDPGCKVAVGWGGHPPVPATGRKHARLRTGPEHVIFSRQGLLRQARGHRCLTRPALAAR